MVPYSTFLTRRRPQFFYRNWYPGTTSTYCYYETATAVLRCPSCTWRHLGLHEFNLYHALLVRMYTQTCRFRTQGISFLASIPSYRFLIRTSLNSSSQLRTNEFFLSQCNPSISICPSSSYPSFFSPRGL